MHTAYFIRLLSDKVTGLHSYKCTTGFWQHRAEQNKSGLHSRYLFGADSVQYQTTQMEAAP